MNKRKFVPFFTVAILLLQWFSPLLFTFLPTNSLEATPAPETIGASKVDYFEGQKKDGVTWTSGNLCSGGGSCYSEGENVPFRLGLKNLDTGSSYLVDLAFDRECNNSVIGYEDFNSMVSTTGDTISDFVYDAGSSNDQEHVYNLEFIAAGDNAEFNWNARLSDEAAGCNGSHLHVTLVTASKTIPLPVNEINEVDPSPTPSPTEEPTPSPTEEPTPTPTTGVLAIQKLVCKDGYVVNNTSFSPDGNVVYNETQFRPQVDGKVMGIDFNSIDEDTFPGCISADDFYFAVDHHPEDESGAGAPQGPVNTIGQFASDENGLVLLNDVDPAGRYEVREVDEYGNPLTEDILGFACYRNNEGNGHTANSGEYVILNDIQGEYQGFCVAFNKPKIDYSDVTVCKYDTFQNPLPGWNVQLLGEFMEAVTVYPDDLIGSETPSYSSDLPLGDYVLKASGTYKYRGGTGLLTDPGYSERSEALDSGQSYYYGDFLPWVNITQLNTSGALGVMVNGNPTDWGYFSDEHTYALGFPGYEGQFEFTSLDNIISDNIGTMNVDIYQGYADFTGDNGCVTFEDVPYGEYVVEETMLSGWENVSGRGAQVSVDQPEETYMLVNLGGRGNLELCKYNDRNGNGEMDEKNQIIEWGLHVEGVEDVKQGENGCYLFENLPVGEYTIYEDQVDGWYNTTDNSQTTAVVNPDETTTVYFGNYKLNQITGFKYLDMNGNGEMDDEDDLLKGWKMRLYDENWQLLSENDTSKEGRFKFSDLFVGDYYVCELEGDYTWQTYPDDVSGVMNQSGMDDEADYCHFVEARESKRVYNNNNFMNQPYGMINGMKFEDMNGDGERGDKDRGIPEWKIVARDMEAVPVEQFDLLANDYDGVSTSYAFDAEKYYIVEVSGTWMNGRDRAVDARYFSNDGWATYDSFEMTADRDPRQLDVVIDNQYVDWGAYNSDHLYKTVVSGDQVSYNFRVFDQDNDPNFPAWYNDNAGSLTVKIYEVEYMTMTDERGYYEMELPLGKYQVVEKNEYGWMQTSPRPGYCHLTVEWGSEETCEFGNFELGELTGYKYEDMNGDGDRDEGEPLLSGWTINLWEGDENGPIDKIRSMKTDDEGYYEFGMLPAGIYYLNEEMDQDGWKQTSQAVLGPFYVNSGFQQGELGFGNFEYGEISGYKIEDMNGDGKLDRSDPRLNDWTIYLWSGNRVKPETIIDQVDTYTNPENDSDGYYEFTGLEAGVYWISEFDTSLEIREGWMQTFPNEKVYGPIVVTSGAEVFGRNFGNFELGLIDGWKILDEDGDGVLTRQEPRLNDWTIYLWEGTMEGPKGVVDSTSTAYSDFYDADGYYTFANLEPGIYWLSEFDAEGDLPEGWMQTYPDPETTGGVYGPLVVTSGMVFNGNNFGNFEYGTIQGRKYEDVNFNGDRDRSERAAEYRLDGWMITLYDEEWEYVASMETGDDTTEAGNVGKGQYRFENLEPGKYYVCEENREGWVQTEPSKGAMYDDQYCFSVNINRSGRVAGGRMFGNYELGMVDGYKWEDIDADGRWDEGEPAVSRWRVGLFVRDEEGRRLVASTMTDEKGMYMFKDLKPGEYYVVEGDREGWVQTYPKRPEFHQVGIKASGTVLEDYNFGNNRPPDIMVEKSNFVDSVEAGETFSYTVRVSNIGAGYASNIRVYDMLPRYVEFVSVTMGGYQMAPRLVSWPLFDLEPGESVVAQITVEVDETVPYGAEMIVNRIMGFDDGSHGTDPNMRNNFDRDRDRLIATPDITVEKTSEPEVVVPGQEFSYELSATNVGNQGAVDVYAVDKLPEIVEFVSATNGGVYDEVKHEVVWSGFNLAAGQTRMATVTVQMPEAMTGELATEVQIENYLEVYQACEMENGDVNGIDDEENEEVFPTLIFDEVRVAEFEREEGEFEFPILPVLPRCEYDPTPENNSDSETDLIEAYPDLVVTKDNDFESVVPGQQVAYTITVANEGDRDAVAVEVTDVLPEGTTFVSSSNNLSLPDPVVSESDGVTTLSWSPYYHPVGAVLEIEVVIELPDTVGVGFESITNSVGAIQGCEVEVVEELPGDDFEPVIVEIPENGVYTCFADSNPENNNAEETDPVNADPLLSVIKDADADSVTEGDTIVFTITYQNSGDQDTTGVVITETVPVNSVFNEAATIAAGTTGWSCADESPAGTVCEYSVGDLAAQGGTAAVYFAVDALVLTDLENNQVLNVAVVSDEFENSAEDDATTTILGDIEGITDERTPDDAAPQQSGSVLGASDTLADTGISLLWSVIIANLVLIALVLLNKPQLINFLRRK